MSWPAGIALWFLLPAALVVAAMLGRRAGGGKGRAAGAMLGLGLLFSGIFDPAQRAAMEEIDRRRESRGADEAEAGDGPPAG